ncbi:hypothetical protein RFI_30935 [Reticulomyxa filosa]|uniref:Uncharacterized protein n=1 Tax=Reticulomyxa filosa TaxID=46433 RepID=X6LYP2_RETFI|nr:hypothetical protein RFI_30935 [Reticulomyxa filosa]|eukprot:ETO06456.1 hypothetical protein RFI_30935 [Reticulomyxa filosa]
MSLCLFKNSKLQNKLNGTIPPKIENMNQLLCLDLNRNRLSGTIPKELVNLVNLIFLFLNQNELTGTIPEGIGNISDLTILELSRNQLSGTIPSEIGNLDLWFLIMEQNELSGTIPKGIENMDYLQYLMLGYNKLSGELPQLDALTGLVVVGLNDNMLSGTIPFGNSYNWDQLLMLSLEKNMFSGNLPKLPNRMNFTSVLTLHMNQFSDHNLHDWYICIPQKKKKKKMLFHLLDDLFQKAPALKILSIYNNPHLKGHLPSSLYNTSVQMFLAHECAIDGVLPWRDTQGSIEFVTLIQNRLSGAMPSNLIQTTNIKNISQITTIGDESGICIYVSCTLFYKKKKKKKKTLME